MRKAKHPASDVLRRIFYQHRKSTDYSGNHNKGQKGNQSKKYQENQNYQGDALGLLPSALAGQ